MRGSFKVIILALIFGAIAGGITAKQLTTQPAEPKAKTQEELIRDFYFTETAVSVSPHHIRKAMAKGDNSFILVDLRSQEEYEREHIAGAINIPAYKDPNTSAYGDVERIVNSFKELPDDVDVIVYCYSIPCMTGRKVGKILAEHDVYVKYLGVGWNEWRYYWNLWNHEHEWDQTDVMNYIATGLEPGKPNITNPNSTGCSIEGDLGC